MDNKHINQIQNLCESASIRMNDTEFVREMWKMFSSIQCEHDFKVAKHLLKEARKRFRKRI